MEIFTVFIFPNGLSNTPTTAPPVIIELTATDASPTSGEDTTIACIVDGVPIPDEVWQKDGVNVNSNGHILTFFVNFDGTPRYGLTIFEVVPEDAGVYTCVISNIAGETSEELEIEVEGGFHVQFLVIIMK